MSNRTSDPNREISTVIVRPHDLNILEEMGGVSSALFDFTPKTPGLYPPLFWTVNLQMYGTCLD